jgi:hypothetical protein
MSILVDHHGPLAHEQRLHIQGRVPAQDADVPGREGADGAAEDICRECGWGWEESTAAVELKADAVCRNGK